MGVVAHGAPVFRIGGDPGGISTRAAVMMERANEFADIHAGLSSLTSDGWQGRAADHFRYKFNLQIKGWLDAQIAFSDASTAYQSYASTLLSAQSQCDEIRSRWEQGRNAVEQAQNNKANARSQAAAEGGTPAFDASCDEGPGRSTMAAAEADFQSLVNQVNESGTLLINALNSGISKLPERTWMDSVARTFKSVYDGFVEATIDLVKLVWFIGGQAALYDIGRVICGYMTPEELVTKWVELPVETVAGLFKVLSEKPGAFFEGLTKGLFDYDTFIDDPGRWVGHAIPDILITIATAGAGGGASAGSKAATGASRASRIGRALFKELTHIADLEDIANLSKVAFNKLKKVGIDAVTNLSTIAENAAERLRRLKEAGHTGHPPLLSPTDNTPSVPSSGAPSSPSHGGPSSPSYSPPNYPGYNSGGTPNLSGTPAPSQGNGGYSGNASHGGAGAADPNSRFAPPGQQSNGMSGATHSGDAGTTDPTSKYAPPTHQQNGTSGAAQPGSTPQASSGAGNASHASHGGADVKDSALPPTDPGHRSNGVSSAAQPAATPHASAAGDAGTGGHAAPAAPAPSASHGAHNNAFVNTDTGGATHGAGNAAAPGTSGHTGAPAAGSHGAPATGAPASGAHGVPASSAPATGAPAAGSHGGASGHGAAGGSPAAPARNNGVGERGATAEAIAQKKPADPDKIFTRSGTDFGAPTNKIDTHAGGNQKNLDHVDVKPGDSDKVPNGQYHPVETAGGAHRGGTDGAPTGDNFAPQPAAAGNGKSPQRPDVSFEKMNEHFSEKLDNVHAGDPGANDLLRSRRDEPTFAGNSNPVHGNGETRGADELVGAGVGRSEASVGAQGSYERAGAFGGSDPSRVSHGANGFGGTADFGANAGHGGHGANGVTNSADTSGGLGSTPSSSHSTGSFTGHGGGHTGADSGTHGGSSTPAQGSYPAAGNTHAPSQAGSGSSAGYGGNHQAGQGANGHSGASSSHNSPTTGGGAPKNEPPIPAPPKSEATSTHSPSDATQAPHAGANHAAEMPHADHGFGSAHKADTPDTAMDQADMPTREIDGNAVRRRAGAAAGNSGDFSWENNIVNKSGKADDAGLPQHASDPTVGADAPHAPHAGADGATDASHAGHGDGASPTADGKPHAADPSTPTHEADGSADVSTGNKYKDKYGSAEPDDAAHPTTSEDDLKNKSLYDILSEMESSHAHHSTPDAPHATHAGADGPTDASHAGHGDGASPTADGKPHEADPTTPTHEADGATDAPATKNKFDELLGNPKTNGTTHAPNGTPHAADPTTPTHTTDGSADVSTGNKYKDKYGNSSDSGSHSSTPDVPNEHAPADGVTDPHSKPTHPGDGSTHAADPDSTPAKADEATDAQPVNNHEETVGDPNTDDAADVTHAAAREPVISDEDWRNLPIPPPLAQERYLTEWANKVCEMHPEIPRDGLLATYNYTTPAYSSYNGPSRDPSLDMSDTIRKQIDDVESLLDVAPNHNGTVFRGGHVPPSVLQEMRETGVFKDKAFLSSSVDERVALDFASKIPQDPDDVKVLFTINSSKGTNIQPVSQVRFEQEVLFHRNTKFKVESVEYDAELGGYRIELSDMD